MHMAISIQKSNVEINYFKDKSFLLVGHFLGGYGLKTDIEPGSDCVVTFKNSGIQLNESFFPWSDLIDISIGGPGVYQTGGGWFGGGFGVKGALEGALFATVMNSLTTKTHTSTVIRIIFKDAELNIHTSVVSPEKLDIAISPLRAFLQRGNESQSERLDSKNNFCTKCGTGRDGNNKFCGSCGGKF